MFKYAICKDCLPNCKDYSLPISAEQAALGKMEKGEVAAVIALRHGCDVYSWGDDYEAWEREIIDDVKVRLEAWPPGGEL